MKIIRDVIITSPGGGRVEAAALVDTGATHLTLPWAWRERLPGLSVLREGRSRSASGVAVKCLIAGPVTLAIHGFSPITAEAAFLEMASGQETVLLGHVPLEAIPAVIDFDTGTLRVSEVEAFKQPS